MIHIILGWTVLYKVDPFPSLGLTTALAKLYSPSSLPLLLRLSRVSVSYCLYLYLYKLQICQRLRLLLLRRLLIADYFYCLYVYVIHYFLLSISWLSVVEHCDKVAIHFVFVSVLTF